MHIYLIRHGQSNGNVHFIPGAMRPKTDPLTDFGREQAKQAAIYLNAQKLKPELIISSPYTRALDTAGIIQNTLAIKLIGDDRLREYYPGDWDGTHVDEFTRRFKKLDPSERYSFHPPNGESWLDEAQRVVEVIKQYQNDSHDCIAIVSHLDPIKAAINLLTNRAPELWDEPVECPPGSIIGLDNSYDNWTVVT